MKVTSFFCYNNSMKEKVIVSACLMGKNCKYNGGNNKNETVLKYVEDKEVFLICPEVMGGLTTPRIPCEIKGDKVINKNGEDKSEEYKKGAQLSFNIAKENNIKLAILKAKSPSCGSGLIYDGSFNGTLIEGNGVCSALFKSNKIRVLSEKEIENLYKK